MYVTEYKALDSVVTNYIPKYHFPNNIPNTFSFSTIANTTSNKHSPGMTGNKT